MMVAADLKKEQPFVFVEMQIANDAVNYPEEWCIRKAFYYN